jgi:multimeric flavodoxin WrbA
VESNQTRREFLTAAGVAIAAGTVGYAQAAGVEPTGAGADKPMAKPADTVKIIAVSCSPRKGKSTATALAAALDGAKEAGPRVAVELVELAGLAIDGGLAVGLPLPPGQKDDFPAVAAKLADPAVRGIIIGTPVYFSGMSYLCKAFMDRWMAFRKDYALADKVAGVLACGGTLHGGQEVTIRSVQDALFCHDMIVVGAGRPTSRFGAVVWANGDDKDSTANARNLGLRVAKVALALAGK